MVFCWHFLHVDNYLPLNGRFDVLPPFTLWSNGYLGVSLFIVLSGYVFGRLTEGGTIILGAFLRNRALRILPLLSVAAVLYYARCKLLGEPLDLVHALTWGWLTPAMPVAGGWSITVELHCYLLLPILLWLARRHLGWWFALIAAGLIGREIWYQVQGSFQEMVYLTALGRLDQFILGLLAARWRAHASGRYGLMALATAGFLALNVYIDRQGTMFSTTVDMESWWAFIGTVEGVFFALLVAWYDTSFKFGQAWWSRLIALMGQVSYSTYLLHFYVVFQAARWIHFHVVPMTRPELAVIASLVCMVAFTPIALLSYKLIEQPFLRLRRPDIRRAGVEQEAPAGMAMPGAREAA